MRWRAPYENMIVITQELARHESHRSPHASLVSTKCFAVAWRVACAVSNFAQIENDIPVDHAISEA